MMNYTKIKKIYEKNQNTKDSTYLVPRVNFDDFYEGELSTVQHVDMSKCTIFRHMDGKLYDLTEDQLKKFKCVGSC